MKRSIRRKKGGSTWEYSMGLVFLGYDLIKSGVLVEEKIFSVRSIG